MRLRLVLALAGWLVTGIVASGRTEVWVIGQGGAQLGQGGGAQDGVAHGTGQYHEQSC